MKFLRILLRVFTGATMGAIGAMSVVMMVLMTAALVQISMFNASPGFLSPSSILVLTVTGVLGALAGMVFLLR